VTELGEHHLRIQSREHEFDGTPDPAAHGEAVRSWLTALVGAEHLALLIGSGLGLAVAHAVGAAGLSMDTVEFPLAEAEAVNAHAQLHATAAMRGAMNIEDQLRSALALLEGLEVLEPGSERTNAWKSEFRHDQRHELYGAIVKHHRSDSPLRHWGGRRNGGIGRRN
jgi:hypothetical protein